MLTEWTKRPQRITDSAYESLKSLVREGKIFREEPMARHTSFHIGGPAEVYLEPGPEEFDKVLSFLYRNGIPMTIIGRGSDLLVSDEGVEGAVLSTAGLNEIRAGSEDGPVLYADGGASLSAAARVAEDHAMTGMEFAAGIPGSVGGALYMNAGAYGGEMSQIVRRAICLDREGRLVRIPDVEKIPLGEEADPAFAFGYRKSCFQTGDLLILSAQFRLSHGDRKAIREKTEDLMKRRREKQPLEYPSAGSTFKRPEGHYAGQLIEESGLKGYRIGDAAVSEKHAGFLINLGNATAKDMYALIRHVEDRVEEETGVRLEPEVRLIGRF